jgi:hypothetical protein
MRDQLGVERLLDRLVLDRDLDDQIGRSGLGQGIRGLDAGQGGVGLAPGSSLPLPTWRARLAAISPMATGRRVAAMSYSRTE